jgi:hypothetical protein
MALAASTNVRRENAGISVFSSQISRPPQIGVCRCITATNLLLMVLTVKRNFISKLWFRGAAFPSGPAIVGLGYATIFTRSIKIPSLPREILEALPECATDARQHASSFRRVTGRCGKSLLASLGHRQTGFIDGRH